MLPEADHALTRTDFLMIGNSLPASPRILAEIGELLSDVDADLSEIARVVRSDPVLAARVIRMSKSVLFGSSSEGMDIEQALTRVGFAQVMPLLGAATLKAFNSRLPLYGIDVDAFQHCSLCHALAAEHLAAEVGENTRAAYLAALMRGLGMVVLDQAAAAPNAGYGQFNLSAHGTYAEFELRTFGVTSADVSRMLLDEWRFPNEIVTAVQHHQMSDPRSVSDRLACVVNVAGEIAASAGKGLPGDAPHWSAAPSKYEVLGLSYTGWEALCSAATAKFELAAAAMA